MFSIIGLSAYHRCYVAAVAAVLIGVLFVLVRFSEYRRRSDENGALPSGGIPYGAGLEIARSIDGRVGR